MLLSDRDILAAQADGHISLDPWTPEMVQPASIDVRLDRFFRLFNNHAYTSRGSCIRASSRSAPHGSM